MQPTSLDDMRQMDRSDFESCGEFLYRGSVSVKAVLTGIIRRAERELSWQGESDAMSLRGFWYSAVKPIAERAFPERVQDPEYRFSRRMTQRLSDVLSEMVMDGELSYRDLNIRDQSRERRVNTQTVEDDKILFVEKEAAYNQLRPLEEVYELSLVSGSGWQATALIEDLRHELRDDVEYSLYVLTDYDPTGFGIASDMAEKAQDLGIDVESVERVGIDPGQVDADTLETERFSPPVSGQDDERWMEKYAIEGEYGLEIEAIGDLKTAAEDLRRLIVGELRDDIRVRKRYAKETEAAVAMAASLAEDRVVDPLVEALYERVRERIMHHADGVEPIYDLNRDNGLWRASVDFDAAEEGHDWLPSPPDEEKIHEAAINGGRLHVPRGGTIRQFRQAVEQDIEDGTIDVQELLSQ